MGKEPFHDWEQKHGLLNKKCIDGFQYWNYMRRDMNMSFRDEYAEIEPAFYQSIKEQKKEGLLSKIRKLASLFLPSGNGRAKHSDVLFLCHPRRQEENGKMVSIYTDYIAGCFPESLTVQRSGLGKYPKETIYSKNLIFLDRIVIKSYIYRYLRMIFTPGKYKRVREQIRCEMEEPFRDLKENYGLHPGLDDFADRAALLYFIYKYRYRQYEKLLKSISPKIIVEVVGLSLDAKILNEAAYNSGIRTVELQHGTGALNIYYPDNTVIKQFPMYYFTFGDFWSRAMKPPIPADHIVSMGFPYHDMMMKDYPPERRKKDKNTVIFLSSRKYGKDLSEVAVELKRIRPVTNVIFKLHPREYADYREKYPALKDSGLEIAADNKTPLYELFSRCSMQVGVESTAIYEGMSFSLDTFIWDIPKAALMKEMVDKGYAVKFKDAGELAGLMDEREEGNTAYDMNDFWKGNSLDNIVNGIKELEDVL